ncbi:MAG: VOC family protein [Candidatus Kerfeldbacteria bacterium]|nr:VOC family protein [Candidatus Kerfeldbacteria bacterium]
MDKVVHFELPADDVQRAKKFYQSSFGWGAMDMPEMKYVIMHTVAVDDQQMPKEAGAINGGMTKRNELVKAPSLSINVDDLAAAVNKVKTAGGTIVKDKIVVGDMGVMAYFKDTEGNILSLWQNLK